NGREGADLARAAIQVLFGLAAVGGAHREERRGTVAAVAAAAVAQVVATAVAQVGMAEVFVAAAGAVGGQLIGRTVIGASADGARPAAAKRDEYQRERETASGHRVLQQTTLTQRGLDTLSTGRANGRGSRFQ